MSDLVKWQMASLVSRLVAVAAGIAQGIFVVRLLSPTDYGLVGIVASVGSVIGVWEHLGLASGSTREISATKSRAEAFKVFISSLAVRWSVSFPLAVGLWLLAPHIANNIYHQSLIIWPLRLQAVVLLLQGTQDIFGAALSGSQKFKPVLIFQAAIALVSLAVYMALVHQLHFLGYFWAMLVVALLGVVGLLIPVGRHFKLYFSWPSWAEFRRIMKAVFSIGLAIYVVKIIYTFWQRLGPLFLGTTVTAAEVGFFNFALFYSTKLLTISEAFSTINLPVMTRKFVDNVEQFKIDFMRNFYKLYSFIFLAAVTAIFWAPEIIHLVVGNKYDSSLVLIAPLTLAFFGYCFVNLLGASVIVPAKLLKEMIAYYVVLILGTVVSFLLLRSLRQPLLVMSLSMAVGCFLSLALLLVVAYLRVRMIIFDRKILLLTLSLLPPLVAYFLVDDLLTKMFFFGVSTIGYLFLLLRFEILKFKNVRF